MNSRLEAVKEFADLAHGNQIRRYTGERYIVHPQRVMETCKMYSDNQAVLAAALLHDVLEDTPVTVDELLVFLLGIFHKSDADLTLRLVIELTDVFTKEAYPMLNRRRRKLMEFERLSNTSADAQTIKYADLIDNVLDIAQNDPDFSIMFLHEAKLVLEKIPAGNRDLYVRAIDILRELEKPSVQNKDKRKPSRV